MIYIRTSFTRLHTLLQSANAAITSKSRLSLRNVRTMSSANRLDLSGVMPPIATPFDKDENVRYDLLEENLNKWNKIPFRGECRRLLLLLHNNDRDDKNIDDDK